VFEILPPPSRAHALNGPSARQVCCCFVCASPPLPTSAPGLGSPLPTSAPGLGSPLPTSAPGLGSPLPHLRRDWARHCPHLRQDWARRCHRLLIVSQLRSPTPTQPCSRCRCAHRRVRTRARAQSWRARAHVCVHAGPLAQTNARWRVTKSTRRSAVLAGQGHCESQRRRPAADIVPPARQRPSSMPAPDPAATSAPGLGSHLPHLYQDWARPCRSVSAAGLASR
jgi:hypothetical protein